MFKFFRKSEQHVEEESLSAEEQLMRSQFEAVKLSPGPLKGSDFERAFNFIERYPESSQAEMLLHQMYATTGQQLKGLNYSSAVKVLERMPDHVGADSIIKGMYKLEEDWIPELSPTVISYMLYSMPDHPLIAPLAKELCYKDIASGYHFVRNYPESSCGAAVIKAMFAADPNIAILLLQELLTHPEVDTFFSCVYAISLGKPLEQLTPNAIIFILDIAPDHPHIEAMINSFVRCNYGKAYQYLRDNPQHCCTATIKKVLLITRPELAPLLE